jgi:aldehyde dehydrogenase (NAD+)
MLLSRHTKRRDFIAGLAIKTITTHYIDGAFVESHGRAVMDIIRATDSQVIARVTLADEEDTRRAIAAAKRAFATYGGSTKEERAKILRRLHEAASARLDDLTAAMVEEYGGVVQFAGPIVQSGVNAFLATEKALQEMPWTRSWDKTTVTLEPVGVAGLITAWNANALFICLKLASAVAAGCTVVIKPSELSSLQTQVLIQALHEAKLPKGLLNVVRGRGDIVGAELVRNPSIDKISFTGSVAVGETIMRDGAATMKRVTLELGGKSPTILLDDVNLDEAQRSSLRRRDAAVFCLGVYTGAVPDMELRKVTVDYTIAFARVLRTASPAAAFFFLSGSGADPTGRSRLAREQAHSL